MCWSMQCLWRAHKALRLCSTSRGKLITPALFWIWAAHTMLIRNPFNCKAIQAGPRCRCAVELPQRSTPTYFLSRCCMSIEMKTPTPTTLWTLNAPSSSYLSSSTQNKVSAASPAHLRRDCLDLCLTGLFKNYYFQTVMEKRKKKKKIH